MKCDGCGKTLDLQDDDSYYCPYCGILYEPYEPDYSDEYEVQ